MAGRWSVVFTSAAEKDLARLSRPIRRRILDKLTWFEEHAENTSLVNLTGEFREFYKLRIGKWRVFYRISWQERLVTIHYIRRRDEAYK